MESIATYCLCGQPYKKDQFMVQCDHCKEWFHGECVNVKEYNAIEIDKYHCPRCEPMIGLSRMKLYSNWHRHDFWDKNAEGKPVQTGTGIFIHELLKRHFSSEGEIVTHMRGQQLTENYLMQNGFNNPIVIDGKDGLDMTIPPDNFSLYDVESYVGSEKEIDVIDVTRQSDFKMSLRDFVEYFNSPNRTRIFNCVSLEFSATSLSRYVEAPLIARSLDWVNSVWPRELSENIRNKPRVQKYCLMSVKDSYTDFHIDFGGTSVWYHVLKGEKIFYFIHPTPANLTLYQQWMTSSTQSETFFADQVDACFKCTLRQGQTMLIPTGWIHAVLTTYDSLVFGGNFLHSLNIPMQLQVYDIEKKIKTAERFKFPSFEAINWYAAKKIMTQLNEMNSEDKKVPTYLLTGVKALLAVLKVWNTDKDYNMSNREQIPDVINSHKLLKDLGKEVRQAERYLNSLNPPKPERESKRKRKKPVNKDFVDFSQPVKAYEIMEPIVIRNKPHQSHPLQTQKLTEPSLRELDRTLAAANSHIKMSLSTPGPVYPYDGPIILTPPKASTSSKSSSRPSSSRLSVRQSSSNDVESLLNASFSSIGSAESSRTTVNISTTGTPSSGSTLTDRNWSEYPVNPNERWVVTNVSANAGDRPGAVLKFTLGSKEANNAVLQQHTSTLQQYEFTTENGSSGAIFDFNDDNDNNREDEFALKIDESPTKRRRAAAAKNKLINQAKQDQHFLLQDIEVDINADVPKNGIESLLKASALTNKLIDSGRASPSTREAIAGMLSISQTCNVPVGGTFNSSNVKTPRKRRTTPPKDDFEENIRNVHQDDEYIYPALDNSDDEDSYIFKPRGRSKVDEAWNPKARVGPLLPKMNRPAREGTKRQAVEKVLEAAAAKRAAEPAVLETHQKRVYRKKKLKPAKPSSQQSSQDSTYNSALSSSSSHSLSASSKPKKGMKTAKQRLGKILKIHKMIH